MEACPFVYCLISNNLLIHECIAPKGHFSSQHSLASQRASEDKSDFRFEICDLNYSMTNLGFVTQNGTIGRRLLEVVS